MLVVAPKHLSQGEIAQHIAENISWIRERIGKGGAVNITDAPKQSASHTENAVIDKELIRDIFTGKALLLCGQLYACKPSTNNQTYLKDDCLFVSEKQFDTRQTRVKTIQTFLKRMATSLLSQEISRVGSTLALCPTKIQFKDLHGLWCSYSTATTVAKLCCCACFCSFCQTGPYCRFFRCISKLFAQLQTVAKGYRII